MYLGIVIIISNAIFLAWTYKMFKRQTKIFDERERNEKELELMIDDINKIIDDLKER